MASSSLPDVYADFTFSDQTTWPINGSSLCPDISNYLNNCYGSFNTSSNQDSIFPPQLFGVSDVSMPEYNNYYQKMGVNNNNNVTQHSHGGDQNYYGFSPEKSKPLLPPTSTGDQSWGNSEGGGSQAESNTKIGRRYSEEERKDRIMKYLKKKNQRNFNKTIKYMCRKTLADRRVRVRGRFVKNNDTCEQHSPMSKNPINHSEKDDDMFSYEYLIQMEKEDGWLHEAMSKLISSP